ncbi:MobD [Burkholderia gladioli]|nr:MobD [Burkholderia gladioli]MBU9385217.1 MobD [Burkholderia gladioli]
MAILSPLRSRKRRKRMQGLTSRELSVLLDAEPTYQLTAVGSEEDGKISWTLQISSADGKKKYVLQAARGEVRSWKGLNFLASFIREKYPHIRGFSVEM